MPDLQRLAVEQLVGGLGLRDVDLETSSSEEQPEGETFERLR